ncbi:MAG TPA: hypothetical protein VII75_05540 [Thermoanaerobaculia bacterium]
MRRLAFLLLVTAPLFAQNITLTDADKAKVVKLTHALEADPFAADARASRKWLADTLTNTNDPNVVICPVLFSDLLDDKDYPYKNELIAQPIFGEGAYLLEHKSAKDDDLEVFVAGVKSLLAVYEKISAKDAKAKRPFLDVLVAARNKNELMAWVDERLKGCRK